MTLVAGTTLAALQAGSINVKWVWAIEGYPNLLTDATPAAAVAAWAGTDYTQALPGLFVELVNQQQIDPFDPFKGGGTATLRVQKEGPADTFGVDTARRNAGAKTVLKNTLDRGSSPTITVKDTTNFPAAPSQIYIGTECIQYNAKTGTTFTSPSGVAVGAGRGFYSPLTPDPSGNGYPRFAQHHRVGADAQAAQLEPTVSAQPRTWIGKWIVGYLHKSDGTNLNSKANALRMFAGKIVGLRDDATTGFRIVQCKHVLDVIKDSTVGRDMFAATIPEGIFIQAGAQFSITDFDGVGAAKTSTALVVVSSGAAGTNQINEGYYTLEQVCNALNSWLAGEKLAARIYGIYTITSPVSTSSGFRTRITWRIPTGTIATGWQMAVPSFIVAFLGFSSDSPGNNGNTTSAIGPAQGLGVILNQYFGTDVPWRSFAFRLTQGGPLEWRLPMTEGRGVALDQYAYMPSAVKPLTSGGAAWGIFLLDEKYLIYGTINGGPPATELRKVFVSPWALPGVQTIGAIEMFGRRADDQTSGPMTIRQVFVLTEKLKTLLKTIFYTTGTSGANHATFDVLGYGLGIAIPGELLGATFEASLDSLPSADAEIACVIDEPTKLVDLFGGDLMLRRAFPRWRNGGLEFCTLITPTPDAATVFLNEDNKAEPTANKSPDKQRAVTDEQNGTTHDIIKIDYDRDVGLSRDGTYHKTLILEDKVDVDDSGGEGTPFTIKARNTYSQFAANGAGVEAVAAGYLATLPLSSRPHSLLTRSINQTLFESAVIGEVALVTDKFARDPSTGQRSIASRPAVIMRTKTTIGGPTPGRPGGKPTSQVGEADLAFLDVNRLGTYVPAALIDATAGAGGFTAGYNAGTKTIRCVAHQLTEASEAADASFFPIGSKVIVVQIDPDDMATYLSWPDIVAGLSGNDITLTTGLVAPAFDVTKTYRIIFDHYTVATIVQQAKCYQASSVNARIESTADPNQYGAGNEPLLTTANGANDLAELHADLAYGDGKGRDVGHEVGVIRLLNQLTDRRTATQAPMLSNEVMSNTTYSAGAGWQMLCQFDLFLTREGLSNTVWRWLNVAPWFRSSDGTATSIRVTICSEPVLDATRNDVTLPQDQAQQTWSTSSTTWQTGAAQLLPVAAKDTSTGIAWIIIEAQLKCETRGLAELVETVRQFNP